MVVAVQGSTRPDSDVESFRERARAWLAENVAEAPRDYGAILPPELAAEGRAWQARLFDAGFAGIAWPTEYGGQGLDPDHDAAWFTECALAEVPPILNMVGCVLTGSALLTFGTPEQKARHLRPIISGERIWCQLFSEPDAGSDLAGLATRAERDGDTYVVNGQKLWASGGRHADWCLLLARTDPKAPKRKGISYFLLDMTTAGVEVRPIRNAVGDSHFCEIFLNDVRIPAANLIGAENSGWQVAQATLGAERGMTMLELAERLGNAGFRWLVESCPKDDPVVGDRLAQFETEISGLRGLCRQLVEDVEASSAGPADASIVKLYYSELLQRMTDFGAEIGGLAAHTELTKSASSGWESGSWMLDFIGSWEWTIPGGSSEIQRTIIAERGLGLPREPSAV
jgi:alkylation response protein AidB-like acyl-CoA dehydrogenase